jgi:outer membrane receptor protein involved in Fe transport
MTTGKTNYNKLIVYTPQEILSFNTILNFNNFKTGMFMRFSNYYYSVADNSYQSMMPRYYLLDVFAEYDFKIYSLKLTLRADVKNILDKQYEVILNYPMPGRSFRAGIKYNI